VTEFPIPTSNSQPVGITVGRDGNLWFTEYGGNKIGRITPAGVVTEFAIPTAGSQPYGITLGPDGNVWFTEYAANKIGRLAPGGAVIEFAIPTAHCAPTEITAGPDGKLWFTEQGGNKIGAITVTGTVTEFAVPRQGSFPFAIAAGPDGNLWFTEVLGNNIGKIGPAGSVTEFSIPTSNSQPVGITPGPDGNLWFTEGRSNKIGRISPAGLVTEFAVPTGGSGPEGISAGADGNLWFVEAFANRVGRITPAALTGSARVDVPGPATQFVVTTTAANPDVAGTPFTVTVTAYDANGLTAIGYTGTVHFSSADPYGAGLPADYTFTAADQGVHTFAAGATLYTAGTWDVTATDTQSGLTGAAFVTVQAAPAVAFQVVAPASAATGAAFDVTVIAVDPYGNTDTHYAGTVTFSTSDGDPGVVLPPDYTFQASDAGMITFPGGATLITLGDQTLTATDTVSGNTGTATVTVTSAPAVGVGGLGAKSAVWQQPQSTDVPTGAARPSATSPDHESVPVRAQSVIAMAHRAALIDHVWSDPAESLLADAWADDLVSHARR
jgi:streptogramin lyase